jgi:dephospho-CoA kinase
MADWTMWATFLAIGTGMAVLATYLICETRIERTQNRILALEREMALARIRENANEKKLAKILDAVVALRETTEDRLANLRDKLNDLLAESPSH